MSFSWSLALCCCWELCTACSGAALLHCTQNQQFRQSRVSLCSLAGTRCQGLFWWHHHCCHTRSPWAESRAPAHACLLFPFYPITKVPPIREPCGGAWRQQIISDDFILITFCLIFFYRRGATPHWLPNIPQVGAGMWGTQIEIHLRLQNLKENLIDSSSCLTWPETPF